MAKESKHAKRSEHSRALCDLMLACVPKEFAPSRDSGPNVCGVHIHVHGRKSALYWLYHYNDHVRVYLNCGDTIKMRGEIQALLPFNAALRARPFPRKGIALRTPLYFELNSIEQAQNTGKLFRLLLEYRTDSTLTSRSKRNTSWASYSEFLASQPENGVEGNRISVLVNRYERSLRNREACIRTYGACCSACGLDFSVKYGEIGDGYIHVHHLTPLAALKGNSRKIDPIRDLRPICPNCHEMLHRSDPPYTIEALKTIIDNAQSSGRRLHLPDSEV
jgi:hypothetical protein